MAVSKRDVDYIKELARLRVNEDETDGLVKDLNMILGYVDKLQELDTESVEILVNPLYLENVFREDVVEESLTTEDFLQNAPDQVDNYLKVPSVIGGEEE
ncbi:Asp-tRNA(Asn)/Glu-tRNA(Gln) amidotransferase subunit GatC [Proteiniclasticum sp. BAD-10]|uniref:Aspartyl/glutamyl-tRNA(Asn/Gln) amidotransferase subunit C n=1 Tax=Proteiniclasticum sediminis TaxID=2804028 RepID=A0A941HRD4_9CLOT|nr:Asp-tRNA(Asn)/Glu-tRNA(Gln) amidotransferase subunit GatC [Proteiniclasticum sediminis]MBR0576880.1 Asp-tRNA(Asn)/Glu-tRNA(Gln) amidotransferase subunit GatC [Proteiniclasticum sediminis]